MGSERVAAGIPAAGELPGSGPERAAGPGRAVPAPMPEGELERLLFELLRRPSHQEAPGCERPVQEFLGEYLRREGIAVSLQELGDGRCNLLARLPGAGGPGAAPLLLTAHADTVPAGGMAEAFVPRVEGGRIFGRGSCDVKGALAAMAAVLVAFRRGKVSLAGDLVLAATAGEETHSPGAFALARSGLEAAYVIVAEPTGLEPGIAHKGVVWLEARFRGRAAHGSVPEQGVNAIYHAARWIQELRERYLPELALRVHPLLGAPTLNVGTIRGGTRTVIVPEECRVGFERRLLPGERAEAVLEEMRGMLGRLAAQEPQLDAQVEVQPVFHGVPHGSFEFAAEHPLLRVVEDAYRQRFGQAPRRRGLQFWTEAALLRELAGVKGILVCGPGRIEEAHSSTEHLSREQLHAAHEIYLRAAWELCVA